MRSFADVIQPTTKPLWFLYSLACVLFGSLFLALMAQIKIFLWFTPVPITMQTFAVFLLGGLLGSKRGALAVVAYLAEGALGLPVFAGGGGLIKLVGPTGGYLLGFILCAFLSGYLLERGWRKSYPKVLAALTLGSAIMTIFGVAWLALYVDSFNQALKLGFYPFLVGNFLKLLAASFFITTGWKALKQA